ncbi:MAG TPA: c-type cytochrome [Candidatus Dormibacteraeota bacterium]|nr:c-type cytochrome [Candidatus Dormibacteraeota bacterium]
MKSFRSVLHWNVRLAASLLAGLAVSSAQTTPAQKPASSPPAGGQPSAKVAFKTYPPNLVQSGGALFRQDCSFCHGRDAGGGESGPDLTRSKLVAADVDGDKIGGVVRNGRPDKGMPRFNYSEQQIAGLMAFIHTQQRNALTRKGGRKGVDVSDLQTGNVEAGKQYFEGAGGCSTCHSPTGDLAGIASRYSGLGLEIQMLYPQHAKTKVSVTLASGQTVAGTLAYHDEFTVALIDATETYRSWRVGDVQYKIDAPVEAHVEQFSKYTDADVHNLMAYLQTLR